MLLRMREMRMRELLLVTPTNRSPLSLCPRINDFPHRAKTPSLTAQEFSPCRRTVLRVSSEGLTVQKHLTPNYATNFLLYIHEDKLRFAKCLYIMWHLALPTVQETVTPTQQ